MAGNGGQEIGHRRRGKWRVWEAMGDDICGHLLVGNWGGGSGSSCCTMFAGKLQALADRKYWLRGGMIRGRNEREGEVEKGNFEGGVH